MSFASLNGVPIHFARLSLPRVGVWTAHLGLEDGLPNGKSTLRVGSVGFTGTVIRGGLHDGGPEVQLVGGAAGLGNLMPPIGYNNAPLQTVLKDIMRVSGETLAQSIKQDILGTQLSHWALLGGSAGAALIAITRSLGLVWRVLFDGTIWVGQDTWALSPLQFDPISESPLQDKVTVAATNPDISPGQSFRGRHVSYVEHILESDRFTTCVWLE